MEPFIVSARKYRPQQFEDVVGQQAITRTLLNAIANNHLAQALLFCGPRGVGKTTCARILAKKINEDGSQQDGEDFAFNIFELDAASNNSVDDIRNLIDQVRIPPQVGKYKVYIIDEVHMLSQSAFNAFLKTLEEPPRHAIFILATTEKHKIIPTILSRCQIFDFRRITVQDAAEYLQYIAGKQGIEADDEALHMIAQKADGAMRDALSIFDRVVSFAGKSLTRQAVAENLNVLDVDVYFETTGRILKGDIPGLLLQFNQILAKGFEGHHYISGLASHFRDLMVCRNAETVALLEASDSVRNRYLEQARLCDGPFLLEALDLANQCELDYKASRNHRLMVELCLMKLASIPGGEKKKRAKDTDRRLIPASHFRNQPKVDEPEPAATPEPAETGHLLQPAESGEPEQSAETARSMRPAEAEQSLQPAATTLTPGPAEAPVSPHHADSHFSPSPSETTKAEVPIRVTPMDKVSGLSLAGLRARKAFQAQKNKEVTDPADLPAEPFEAGDLELHWNSFVASCEVKGRKILASNLSVDQPKIREDHIIWIELPNSTMKKEVERDQLELMEHLRRELNNYRLQLKVTVNEEAERQYAYTPQEKYEKLREKNPDIDLLRKAFDLEL